MYKLINTPRKPRLVGDTTPKTRNEKKRTSKPFTYTQFTNGYYRNDLENQIRQNIHPFDKERLSVVSDMRFEQWEKLLRELISIDELQLIEGFDINWWKYASHSVFEVMTRDSKTLLTLKLMGNHTIKLNLIYSDKDSIVSGRTLLNHLLNLTDKYKFHLFLSAVPLQFRDEFTEEWFHSFKKKQKVVSPLRRNRILKTKKRLKDYVVNTKTPSLDSLYSLYDYYTSFGFVPIPTMMNSFFMSSGFNTLTELSMVYPCSKIEFNEDTFPFYKDKVLSQVGSVKKVFNWKESVNFCKWMFENRRVELLTRNLDLYKHLIMIDMTTQNYLAYKDELPEESLERLKDLNEYRKDKHFQAHYNITLTNLLIGSIEENGMNNELIKQVRQLPLDLTFTGDLEIKEIQGVGWLGNYQEFLNREK